MEYPIKTVCVIGLGYIGLPTAATLASRGIDVVGVDVNPRVVEAVNAGRCYFAEPDLDMLLRAATTLGKLRAISHPEPADAFVIAVPTPMRTAHPISTLSTRQRMRSLRCSSQAM
jgi:UDP-N-acetyl-D-mannosaminuronic acid dehydrogenase